MTKGGKRKPTRWSKHVAATMLKMPGVALRKVLVAASKTYNKGKAVVAKAMQIPKSKRRTRKKGRKRRTRRVTISEKRNLSTGRFARGGSSHDSESDKLVGNSSHHRQQHHHHPHHHGGKKRTSKRRRKKSRKRKRKGGRKKRRKGGKRRR